MRTNALSVTAVSLLFWLSCERSSVPTLPGAGDSSGDTGQGGATTAPGGPGDPERRIDPANLVYRGALRLPAGSGGTSWEWGGNAMAYYPDGDPDGPDDGHPGSLFGTGHDWYQQISEISIPAPVISSRKHVNDLPTARTLQPFHDVRGDLNVGALELPRAGLAYLPPQGLQTTGKLHFCWGQHYQEQQVVSHGWCELDLSDPRTAGGWYIGQRSNYSTNDYLFPIPEAWAAAHTPGKRLATGRYRDGGWSGQGPALFAYGPWNEGNPPAPNTRLAETVLLLYSSSAAEDPTDHKMNGYHHADEWSGGVWLTAGDKAAVVFVGTKGLGDCWYGFANGVRWPDEPPYPPIPAPPNDDRGWWSTRFVGQFVFYDAADLAAVARGELAPYQPQPYATLEIDQYLFNVRSDQQKYHLGAAAYDPDRRLLYVFEFRADGDKPLVHAWEVQT